MSAQELSADIVNKLLDKESDDKLKVFFSNSD